MEFRLEMPLHVRCHGDYLDTWLTAVVQLNYHAGKWTAQCQDPPALSMMCDSIEEALVSVAQELQQLAPTGMREPAEFQSPDARSPAEAPP